MRWGGWVILDGSSGGRVWAVGSRSTEDLSDQEGSLSRHGPSGDPTVPMSPSAV